VHIPWFLVARFGDASFLFPLAAFVAMRLAYQGLWKQAYYWLFTLCAGASAIVAGKLAFEFGGWSIPSANLYSISGHAMLTAAVYPMSLTVLGSIWGEKAARMGTSAGIGVALLAAVALIAGRYHTMAETVIGMGIGFIVTWANLRPSRRKIPAVRAPALNGLVLALVLVVLVPVSLYPIRVQLWSKGLDCLGVTERYSRRIAIDPISGGTVVTIFVQWRRLRS
jgi:Na+-transporting NADH:ubiquinone oxidoreductase subunit NqrB